MNRLYIRLLLSALAVGFGINFGFSGSAVAEDRDAPLAHAVFFTLKDRSPEARRKLVDSCNKYLTNHEGTLSYSVGTVAEDVKEPVSDHDFDIALCVVFKNKAAGATYQSHPRHKQFIEENKASWSKVRVFDSYLAKTAH